MQGDIYCYLCGKPLRGYVVKAKDLHYYKCATGKGVSINAIKGSQPQCRIGAHELYSVLLLKYELKTEFIEILDFQITRIFNLANHSIKSEEAAFKKRLSELEIQRDNLQERFAFGKITNDLYDKFLMKIENEIYSFKEKHPNLLIDKSNLKNHQKQVLELVQNLSKEWVNGSIEHKKGIQQLVFPEGVWINPFKREYLTPKVNSLFHLTKRISSSSDNCKQKIPVENNEDSGSVPRAGIEPARAHTHRFLRPTRLPIPPPRQMNFLKGCKDIIFNRFNAICFLP